MEKNPKFLLDVLERTYFRDDNRPEFKGIFESDYFIYNTDLYALVRIPKKLLNKELYEPLINKYDKKRNLAISFNNMKNKSNPFNSIKVDFEFFEKFLTEDDTAPTGENKKCTECHGNGNVEWTYESINKKTYEKDFECPICDGDGLMEVVSQKIVEGSKTFYKEFISIAHHKASDIITIKAKYFRIFVKILEYYQGENVQVSIALNKDNIIFRVNNEIELMVMNYEDSDNYTDPLNFQF